MCPTAMLARASLLLCLVVGTRQLSITELKVPVALEAGENAELKCRYDRAGETEDKVIVKWWWTSLNTSANISQLYQRIGNVKGRAIRPNIETKSNDTIVLLKTTPANSGVYECEVSLMSDKAIEVRQQQELTIFTPGSGPNLTISEVADGPHEDTENDVLIECKADDVAPAPDIVLKIDGKELNMTEYITGPDLGGLYDIVGHTTLSKEAVADMQVHCELLYVNNNVVHPPYFDVKTYAPSGAQYTTDAPGNATEPDATPDSLQNPNGASSQCRLSWALLFALGLLTHVPALL